MSAFTVAYKKGCWSKDLTPDQRKFAEQVIARIAENKAPKNHSDHYGTVKPLFGNLKDHYSYKPCKHLRLYGCMDIRIIFKVNEKQVQVFVVNVASRDEVYDI